MTQNRMSSESRTECNSGYAESRMRKTNVNFNFKVNIERLNPFTGQLLYVDRMTSDYAQAHPFDVDGYLKQVADKHGADYQRVREFFYYPLQGIDRCPAKHRDKVVKDPKTGIGQIEFGKWPSFVNGCEPAIIEAWNEGAKFATKGFKYGDTLPDRLPMCKITRLEDGGWIALFPKDKHLLDADIIIDRMLARPEEEVKEVEVADQTTPTPPTQEGNTEPRTQEGSSDAFAMRQEVISASVMHEEPKPKRRASKPQTSNLKPQTHRQLDLFGEPIETSVIDDAQDQSNHKLLKAAGITLAGVAVMAILIHTGMLIPMGLIGLAAGGILK